MAAFLIIARLEVALKHACLRVGGRGILRRSLESSSPKGARGDKIGHRRPWLSRTGTAASILLRCQMTPALVFRRLLCDVGVVVQDPLHYSRDFVDGVA